MIDAIKAISYQVSVFRGLGPPGVATGAGIGMLSKRLADGRRAEAALLSMALDFVLAGRAATASALVGITPIALLLRGPMACDIPTDPALYRPMGIAA